LFPRQAIHALVYYEYNNHQEMKTYNYKYAAYKAIQIYQDDALLFFQWFVLLILVLVAALKKHTQQK
jgi:hypothetical protein